MVRCWGKSWTGQQYKCDNILRQVPDLLQAQLPLCASFKIDLAYINDLKEVTVVLYMEDGTCNKADESFTNMFQIGGTGVIVYLHDRGLPSFSDGMLVAAGTESNIILKAREIHRLSLPYSNCSVEAEAPEDECITSCRQDLTRQTCGCLDPYLQADPNSQKLYNYCGDVGQNTSVFDERLTCMYSRKEHVNDAVCLTRCPPPCFELRYEAQQSTANWPHDIYFDLMYQYLKKSTGKYKQIAEIDEDHSDSFVPDFSYIDDTWSYYEDQSADNDTDYTYDYTDTNNTVPNCTGSIKEVLTRNLLKVNIQMARRMVEVSKDTPKITLSQVTSYPW